MDEKNKGEMEGKWIFPPTISTTTSFEMKIGNHNKRVHTHNTHNREGATGKVFLMR